MAQHHWLRLGQAGCLATGPGRLSGASPVSLSLPGVNCTATSHLSSRWLSLDWAGVRRHIRASKACFAARLSFNLKEIHVEALPGNVMAGAGGSAGPAQDVRRQPPGRTLVVYYD